MNSPEPWASPSRARPSARKPNPFPDLASISKAPSLTTLNGFGFKLYGKSDFDPETDSYMTTQYFVALFVPLFPIARYRVISDDGSRFRFLGKGSLRGVDKAHIAAFLVVALLVIGSARVH